MGNSHSNSKIQDIQVPQITEVQVFCPFLCPSNLKLASALSQNLKEVDLAILYQW